MRNRAKCRLCGDIIESLHYTDHVVCTCCHIEIWGGLYELKSRAGDYNNFLRIDDMGNEITVEYKEKDSGGKEEDSPDNAPEPVSRAGLLDMLDTMIQNTENLPEHARMSSVNHNDLTAFMLVVSAILRRG